MRERAHVVVVDDHRTFSELLELVLQRQPDLSCVGTAVDSESARTLVRKTQPDIAILDLELGNDDGVALAEELLEEHPGLRVVILTAHTDPQLIQRAARVGAHSLLPKNGSLEDLLRALRADGHNGLTVHPELLKSLVMNRERGPSVQLTDRELQVLRMLRDGCSVKQISRTLTISEHTTRGYVKKILVKLDAHSQLEAVASATRMGLL